MERFDLALEHLRDVGDQLLVDCWVTSGRYSWPATEPGPGIVIFHGPGTCSFRNAASSPVIRRTWRNGPPATSERS